MIKFRPATAVEYAAWLRLHLDNGGTITHAYDYPMPDFYLTAQASFILDGERGTRSRHILVPDGIEYGFGQYGQGHNVLHLANGSIVGGLAACFANEVMCNFPGYEERIAADRARRRAWEAERAADAERQAETDLGRYALRAGTTSSRQS